MRLTKLNTGIVTEHFHNLQTKVFGVRVNIPEATELKYPLTFKPL